MAGPLTGRDHELEAVGALLEDDRAGGVVVAGAAGRREDAASGRGRADRGGAGPRRGVGPRDAVGGVDPAHGDHAADGVAGAYAGGSPLTAEPDPARLRPGRTDLETWAQEAPALNLQPAPAAGPGGA